MVLRFFFIPITGGTNAILMRLEDAMLFGLPKSLAIMKMLVSACEFVNSRCEFSVSWFDFAISWFDFVISWFGFIFRLFSGGFGLFPFPDYASCLLRSAIRFCWGGGGVVR